MNDASTSSSDFKIIAFIITFLHEKTLSSRKNHKSGLSMLEALYVYRVFCGTLLDQSDSLVIPNTCSLTSPIRFTGSAVEIGEQRRQSAQEKTQSLAVATCSVAVQKPATSTPAVYCHDVTVCTVEARNSSLLRHNNS